MDAERVRHRVRRRHHHRRRARRPLRPAPGLHLRACSVHRRLGGLRARARTRRADRRPHRAGPGRRGRAAAQPHDPDARVPAGAPRDDRRHLRRARRAGRRDRAAGRRRGHPGDRLALDLLDQRPDRRRRRCRSRPAAAAGELRRAGAARPAGRRARHRRRRRPRLGAGARQPGRLGERRDRQLRSPPAPPCWSPSSPGSARAPSRWCRCACFGSRAFAARQRHDLPDVRARSSPPRSWSPRSSSSPAATRRWPPACGLLPFFATPMIISPIAGAVSDRIGRRPRDRRRAAAADARLRLDRDDGYLVTYYINFSS